MALFGGSSTKQQTTNREQVLQNVDNRVTEGDGAVIGGNLTVGQGDGGGDISIMQTDLGALDTAENVVNRGFESQDKTLSSFSGVVGSAVSAAQSLGASALQTAQNVTRDETGKTIQYALIVGAAVALAYVLSKGRKQ